MCFSVCECLYACVYGYECMRVHVYFYEWVYVPVCVLIRVRLLHGGLGRLMTTGTSNIQLSLSSVRTLLAFKQLELDAFKSVCWQAVRKSPMPKRTAHYLQTGLDRQRDRCWVRERKRKRESEREREREASGDREGEWMLKMKGLQNIQSKEKVMIAIPLRFSWTKCCCVYLQAGTYYCQGRLLNTNHLADRPLCCCFCCCCCRLLLLEMICMQIKKIPVYIIVQKKNAVYSPNHTETFWSSQCCYFFS